MWILWTVSVVIQHHQVPHFVAWSLHRKACDLGGLGPTQKYCRIEGRFQHFNMVNPLFKETFHSVE